MTPQNTPTPQTNAHSLLSPNLDHTLIRSKHAQSVTLLQELRPGMRLHGGVVGVTDFAAFLDVKVVRKGPGGKVSE